MPFLSQSGLQVTLNNGVEMPLVGFGTAGLGAETKQAVAWALQAGYRLLDSAQVRSGSRCRLRACSIGPSHGHLSQYSLTSLTDGFMVVRTSDVSCIISKRGGTWGAGYKQSLDRTSLLITQVRASVLCRRQSGTRRSLDR